MNHAETQERTLARWLDRRDDESLAAACAAWDNLACYYGTQYAKRVNAEYEDCRQHARIGLLKALRLYDPSRGCRFTTYVVYVIRTELARYRITAHNGMRLPAWVLELQIAINRAPTDDPARLSALLGVPQEQVELAQRAGLIATTISLTALRPDENREDAWEFGAIDPRIEAIGEGVNDLAPLFTALTPIQREAMQLRYAEGLSLREAGERRGVSRNSIWQIEQTALRRMRKKAASLGMG